VANQFGFVVAYLDSPPPPWKAPSEIAYIGSMISQLKASQNIDPQRVYVVGFSIGGEGTFRAACEFSGQIAAIAVVSTAMAPISRKPCNLSRPVSELNIAGTHDEFPVQQTAGSSISADQTAAAWRMLDGCSSQSQTTQVGPTTQTTWSTCNDGTSVAEYVVNGGSHAWPGAPGLTGADAQYNATQAVWSFLSQHRGTTVTTAEARLISLHVAGGGRRKLQGVVRVTESAVQVKLTLARHRRTVVSKTFALLRGSRTLPAIAVPRSVPKGPVTVTLKISDSYGRRLTISRTLQVPAAAG
jgi:dienelactone hydrolase